MVHTFHFAGSGDYPSWGALAAPLSVGDAATKAQGSWSGQFTTHPALWSAQTAFRKVTATLLDSAGRASEVAEVPVDSVQAGSGNSMLPTSVACAVTLRSARAGRSYRGRVFMGGFSAAVVNGFTGRLTTDARDGLLQAVQMFLRGMRTAGYVPVVLSPTKSAATPITALDIGDVFDTQRSRRNGFGEVRTRAVL